MKAPRTQLPTFEGFLGQDREIRETPQRLRTMSRWNPIAEMDEEFEVTIPGREYLVLSLAVRTDNDPRSKPRWHRLIVFDLHRQSIAAARLTRKGDRIRVKGRPETYRFTTPDGQLREIPQIVVQELRLLRPKVHCEVP